MSTEVVSIQVGLPQLLGQAGACDPMDRPWTTGFLKEAVSGPVFLGRLNLVGDGQADLKHHGGLDKAVLAYPLEHYAYWRSHLDIPDLPQGGFGENFTTQGQSESEVCIGDVYTIGEAEVQVSQPRQPCWKLARRWRVKSLALAVQKTGYTGWYFRVLREGFVEAKTELILRERPCPQWTIAKAHHLMHYDLKNREASAELASCPFLSASWTSTLMKRVNRNINPDPKPRLEGEVD